MRPYWEEEGGARVLRGPLTGRVLAKVAWTGSQWRGTTWTKLGTSSTAWSYINEVMDWCEDMVTAGVRS